MAAELPTWATLKKAIDLYLALAYPPGQVPAAVRERVSSLETLPEKSPVPAGSLEECGTACRRTFVLRLGQQFYPHMKLLIESTPDGTGYFLRPDAHDSHLHAPPGSPDEKPLAALRLCNQQLVEKIEASWAAAGLPTFREYLKNELIRKRKGTSP